MNLSKPIILVGMMGSGKSSLGRLLAARLHFRFVDSDAEIEKRAGKSIPEIFKAEGEAHFRALEKTRLAEIAREKNVVVATGGGAVLNEETRQLLKESALTIWLKADAATLYARVKNDKNRPLLQGENPQAKLESLLKERVAFYAESDIHINTAGKSPEKLVEEIVQKLQS